MKFLFDGGAFQQGISGGILNVAINFLNALRSEHPSIAIALLLDERFGTVNREFLGRLSFTPDLLTIDTRPSSAGVLALTSDDPALEVRIDGRPIAVEVALPVLSFDVGSHANAIEIVSRAARPKDVIPGSLDPRLLGFSLARMRVVTDHHTIDYFADADVFRDIGDALEQDFRWNSGRLQVPASLVLASRGGKLEVHLGPRLPYRLFDGRYDRYLKRVLTLREASHRQRLGERLAALMTQHRITAYFGNHFIPIAPARGHLFSWVYDVLPLTNPDFFGADAVENFMNVKAMFERSDAVFCISETTKSELIRHTSVRPEVAHATGIGISPHIERQPDPVVQAFRQRRDLPPRYFVCVATIEPRKNHLRLLQGYRLLLDRDPGAPMLVIAGKPGWGFGEVFGAIRDLGLEDKVRHIGDIADHEVPSLYSGAVACVYPSLREGFGLPVLEAMACGIPAVTSRNSSMEELAHGAALLVDPMIPASIAMGMAIVLEDPGRVAALVSRSAEVVRHYGWPRIARQIGDIMIGALR